MRETTLDPASFRDPNNRVFFAAGEVYRALSGEGLAAWEAFASTAFAAKRMASGDVVSSALLPEHEAVALPVGQWAGVLHHERIEVLSYPYEWPVPMLRDAAQLYLDLAREALGEGLTTTDATPFNVQWRGPRPVYIDVGTFCPRREGAPWHAYRQFCEMWLVPLLIATHRNIDSRPLMRGRLAGVPIAQAPRFFSFLDRFRPGVLVHVALHAMAAEKDASSEIGLEAATQHSFSEKAHLNTLRSLEKLVRGLPTPRRRQQGEWERYEKSCPSYREEDRAAKRTLVEGVLRQRHWKRVLDLGANQGEYALLAADHADAVIAVEQDLATANQLYGRVAASDKRNILCLAMDVLDPAPAQGFGLVERQSFVDRCRAELVLALALVHHLVIGGQVPFTLLVDMLADLAGRVLIEWVPPEDPMVARMLRLRSAAFYDYRLETFERAVSRRFAVEDRLPVGQSGRVLFLLKRITPPPATTSSTFSSMRAD